MALNANDGANPWRAPRRSTASAQAFALTRRSRGVSALRLHPENGAIACLDLVGMRLDGGRVLAHQFDLA